MGVWRGTILGSALRHYGLEVVGNVTHSFDDTILVLCPFTYRPSEIVWEFGSIRRHRVVLFRLVQTVFTITRAITYKRHGQRSNGHGASSRGLELRITVVDNDVQATRSKVGYQQRVYYPGERIRARLTQWVG